MKRKLYLVQFLLNTQTQQIPKIIKILSKDQLQWIIEIIYNVVHEVCPVSDGDKKLLSKKKSVIRHLLSKQLTRYQRKEILQKLKLQLPIFLRSYLQYVS